MRLCSLFFVATCVSLLNADDWPQYMGQTRDGVWRENAIVQSFPASGLPVKWRVPIKYGYGGPAVRGGRVFVMDYDTSGKIQNSPDGANELTGKERVLCFASVSGKKLWEHAYDQPYKISYAAGPRCTPTLDSGKVYTLGAQGRLTCLDEKSGNVVWEKSLPETYKTDTAIWGYSSHPLIDGDLLFTLAGGEGTVCIALNKNTGEEVWTALSASEPGYNAPTMIEHAGVKQLLIWTPAGLNSLNPKTGKVYWTVNVKPDYGMSIMGPQKAGNLLYASAIGNNSALIRLDDDKPAAEIVWRGKVKTSIFCSNSTPLLHNGTIYGCDVETGTLMAANLADGKRLWQTTKPTDGSPRRSRHATAFLVKHENAKHPNRFFLFNELGDLILADLSPEQYEELGRFHVLEPTNEAFGRNVVWSHPAFAEKSLFARNDKELVCVDLADPEMLKLGADFHGKCMELMRNGDGSHETYEEALGWIEKTCELMPEDPFYMATKAWALMRTDRTDKAYMLLEEVDELLKQPTWDKPEIKTAVEKIRREF